MAFVCEDVSLPGAAASAEPRTGVGASLVGLDISLMERLLCSPGPYAKSARGYDPLYVTMLVQNYRSHPDILKVPSSLFYHNALLAKASAMDREAFVGWDALPNPAIPVVFFGVCGESRQVRFKLYAFFL